MHSTAPPPKPVPHLSLVRTYSIWTSYIPLADTNPFPHWSGISSHALISSGIIIMSSISASRFAYQKLGRSQTQDDDDDGGYLAAAAAQSSRRYWRFRRRFVRVKVPSLKRFLRRKLMKSIPCLRGSVAKVFRRLKEGQAHLGDLFAGNYFLMQINPASINRLHKSSCGLPTPPHLDFSHHHHHHHHRHHHHPVAGYQ